MTKKQKEEVPLAALEARLVAIREYHFLASIMPDLDIIRSLHSHASQIEAAEGKIMDGLLGEFLTFSSAQARNSEKSFAFLGALEVLFADWAPSGIQGSVYFANRAKALLSNADIFWKSNQFDGVRGALLKAVANGWALDEQGYNAAQLFAFLCTWRARYRPQDTDPADVNEVSEALRVATGNWCDTDRILDGLRLLRDAPDLKLASSDTRRKYQTVLANALARNQPDLVTDALCLLQPLHAHREVALPALEIKVAAMAGAAYHAHDLAWALKKSSGELQHATVCVPEPGHILVNLGVSGHQQCFGKLTQDQVREQHQALYLWVLQWMSTVPHELRHDIVQIDVNLQVYFGSVLGPLHAKTLRYPKEETAATSEASP